MLDAQHSHARAFAAVRSSRYLRNCERAIESDAPVLMLAGVFHPRLVVSRGVRRALTADQLAVAVRHEEAHGASHDNLKRLLLLLAPDAVPFVRWLGVLDRAWSRLAEWAADDRAVDGSRRALARARLGAGAGGTHGRLARCSHWPLRFWGIATISPCASSVCLPAALRRLPAAGLWPAIVLALAIAAVAVQPATFVAVHRALEALAH